MTYRKLSNTIWEYKYHIVFIPKIRKRNISGQIRRISGDVFHELASHRESIIEENHLIPDHVHLLLSIPPKYTVSKVVDYMKKKSSINIARELGNSRNATGHKFRARGYFVSSVGRNEEIIRRFIRHQEKEDQKLEQMNLFRA